MEGFFSLLKRGKTIVEKKQILQFIREKNNGMNPENITEHKIYNGRSSVTTGYIPQEAIYQLRDKGVKIVVFSEPGSVSGNVFIHHNKGTTARPNFLRVCYRLNGIYTNNGGNEEERGGLILGKELKNALDVPPKSNGVSEDSLVIIKKYLRELEKEGNLRPVNFNCISRDNCLSAYGSLIRCGPTCFFYSRD